MTLVYLGLAWLAGIFLGSLPRLSSLPSSPIGLSIVVPLAGFLLWWREANIRRLSAVLLFLLLGIWRYSPSIPPSDEGSLAFYNGQGTVKIRGVVVGYPDVGERWTHLTVAAQELAKDEEWREVKGKVLVVVPHYPAFGYGDELELEGELRKLSEFEDPSYREYLSRQRIYSWLDYRYRQAERLGRGRGNPFYGVLYGLRERTQATIARLLPAPESALLAGILLGLERGIAADLLEKFNQTNTRHIIAISGFNISIIAGYLSILGRRLWGRRSSIWLVIGGVILYTLLVGADAAVVRAAIMGVLYAVAIRYGRQRDALIALVIAAFLMTLYNPFVLWGIGFRLSFMATLGLILYAPILEDYITGHIDRAFPQQLAKTVARLINEAFTVTLVANLMTLPIIVYYFGRLPLVTFLSNLLVLPAQAGVMVWGGLSTLLGLVYLPLGRVVGWVAWLFLTYTIKVVELTAKIPHASLFVGRPHPISIALYYGLLLASLAIKERKGISTILRDVRERLNRGVSTKALLTALLVVALLVAATALTLPDGKLHVIFFDVGEGDAIFIRTPAGRKILVDGGPSDARITAALGRELPFWDRTLELIVLTHPDEDHLAGLISALERYRVRQVVDSGQPCDMPCCSRWEELLAEKGLSSKPLMRGMLLRAGSGVSIEVLHPEEELMKGTESDDNNNSVVLRLIYGRASFLLTGDIQKEAEEVLLASGQNLEGSFLKVAHHGSHNSSSPPFLRTVSPQLAIISVGPNPWDHPRQEVLERLSAVTILRTDEDGTVEIVTDGAGYWLRKGR